VPFASQSVPRCGGRHTARLRSKTEAAPFTPCCSPYVGLHRRQAATYDGSQFARPPTPTPGMAAPAPGAVFLNHSAAGFSSRRRVRIGGGGVDFLKRPVFTTSLNAT